MCLKKRVKGLMALMACIMVLAGTSLPVHAADYQAKDLHVGQVLAEGDEVKTCTNAYGGLVIYYNSIIENTGDGYKEKCTTGPEHSSTEIYSWDIYGVKQSESGSIGWKVSDINHDSSLQVYYQNSSYENVWRVYLVPAFPEDASTTPATATAVHVHNYEWVTVREATATEDGEMDYMCSCGDVKERQIIPKYVGATKEVNDALDAAKSGQTITLDTGDNCSFNRDTMDKIANDTQNNIKVVIKYIYKGVHYILTIPAGSNSAAIRGCVDGNGYAGFRQIDKVFPGTVVK